MGNGCMKRNENVYFRARKEAARYNEKLSSREGAAELLGLSTSTLADYELGITKVVPVDKVMLMADLYNCPELKTGYCKYECPIGREMPIATRVGGVEGIALRMLRELDPDRIKEIEKQFIEIASDGEISPDERPQMEGIMAQLDQVTVVIGEMRLAAEKALREEKR